MAEAYENISYFPSYEMVTFLGINALENDLRHIRGPVVEKVSRGFEKFVSL